MRVVSTIFEAYEHFRPYDQHRDSETVVIYNNDEVSFLHWDKGAGEFTRETSHGKEQPFPGEEIMTIGLHRLAAVLEGLRLQ